MSVPDYQSIMLPLLKQIGDNKEYKMSEIIDILADHFNLNQDDRRELLPSGKQTVFSNRVAWAKTYLKKAGLIDSPKRASIIITTRGQDVLKQKLERIDVKFLKQYSEFLVFQNLRSSEENEVDTEEIITKTPEETLETAYQRIRKSLGEEIINKVIEQKPDFFEKLVVELLVRMGYGGSMKDAGKAIGKTNDEGIDGTIKEDKLGLDIIYIQAKRWKPGTIVGRPEIQKFVGALAGQGAKKGIFITTSSFSKDALEYQPKNETKVVLIDGSQLAQLMIDYNLGVAPVNSYEIKRIDNDYFEED